MTDDIEIGSVESDTLVITSIADLDEFLGDVEVFASRVVLTVEGGDDIEIESEDGVLAVSRQSGNSSEVDLERDECLYCDTIVRVREGQLAVCDDCRGDRSV